LPISAPMRSSGADAMQRGTLTAMLWIALGGCDAAYGTDTAHQVATAPSPYFATAIGRIDSASEARQLVASVDGVIARVDVERGQRVRTGEVLLRIDCGPRNASAAAARAEADQARAESLTVQLGARPQQMVAAEAAVRSAAAARSDAADRLAQALSLIAAGFISKRDLAARENAFASADAAWRAARAEAALVGEGPRASERRAAGAGANAAQGHARAAAAQAGQCALTSPIDGEVVQVLRRAGEFSGASQGTPLVVVADLKRLIVRTEVSERDAARVVAGQRADVWIEGERQRWPGRVVQLASVMGRRSARSLDPTDRFDRDVREAFVELDGALPPAVVGLRVVVGLRR
jgi:multidrug resistance efflux pump